MKLRLRLPTDGSVDLDKLRAALEAQLEKNRQPVVEEPVVVEPVVAQPELAPIPEIAAEPSAAWAWIKARPFFLTAIAAAFFSFVMGITLIVREAANPSTTPGITGWLFVFGVLALITSFAFVVKRESKDTPQVATFWDWVLRHKKLFIGTSLGMATLVVIGLWIAAFAQYGGTDSKPEEIAKGTTPPKVITPTPPKPPVTPTPPAGPTGEPAGETVTQFKPKEGFMGRLMVVLSIGCALGMGLLQVRRAEEQELEALKESGGQTTPAKADYIDFWPAFRHFVATQGAFVLVAAATGACVLIWDTTRYTFGLPVGEPVYYSVWSALAWSFAGMGLAGLGVMGLGAAGLNLMPALDRTVSPTAAASSVIRFARRKVWHIILMGIIFGAVVSVSQVEHIRHWWDLWLKWSLGIGLLVGVCWKGTKLLPDEKDVKALPAKQRPGQFRALLFYNQPLIIGFTLGVVAFLMVAFQFHWVHLWWMGPAAALGVVIVLAVLRGFPRLLRHWVRILFFPAMVAMVCDWFVWAEIEWTFWAVLAVLSGLFAFGTCQPDAHKEESGWLLLTPSNRRDFQPVLNHTKTGLEVRWGSLLLIAASILLLLAAVVKWTWSGKPPSVANNHLANSRMQSHSGLSFLASDEDFGFGIDNPNESTSWFEPWLPARGNRHQLEAAVRDMVHASHLHETKRRRIELAWQFYAQKEYPLACYNYGLIMFDKNQQMHANQAFKIGSRLGHLPSIYNYGVLMFYQIGVNYDLRNQNRSEAIRQAEFAMTRAWDGGHPDAGRMLAHIYAEMDRIGIQPLKPEFKELVKDVTPIDNPGKLDRSDVSRID